MRVVALPVLVAAKTALYSAMHEQGVGNTALAERLGLSEGAVRRLIDLDRCRYWRNWCGSAQATRTGRKSSCTLQPRQRGNRSYGTGSPTRYDGGCREVEN